MNCKFFAIFPLVASTYVVEWSGGGMRRPTTIVKLLLFYFKIV